MDKPCSFTTYGTEEDWLGARSRIVTGSDVYALMEGSWHNLWAVKTGRKPGVTVTAAMDIGRLIEPWIGGPLWKRESGGRPSAPVPPWTLYTHNDCLGATLDFWTSHNPARRLLEPVPLEIKNHNAANAPNWADGPPRREYLQMQTQMICTNCKTMSWIVLLGGSLPLWGDIKRNDFECEKITAAAASFCEDYLWPDIAPPADDLEETTKSLKTVHDEIHDTSMALPARFIEQDERRVELVREIKEREAELTGINNAILETMGNTRLGLLPGAKYTRIEMHRREHTVKASKSIQLRRSTRKD